MGGPQMLENAPERFDDALTTFDDIRGVFDDISDDILTTHAVFFDDIYPRFDDK